MRFLLFLLLIAFGPAVHSQDNHYWYSPYCAGGFLMPGAVVTNNFDTAVLFYNPALLANSIKSSISFSGALYQVDRINIINGAGVNRSLTQQNFSVVPQIISGSFLIRKPTHIHIAYALLHDPGLSFEPTQRRDEKINVLDDSYSPGPEQFIGQFLYQNDIDEFTGSVSAGYAITPKLKVGAGMEATQRKQTYSLNLTARALVNATSDTVFPVVSDDVTYFTHYSHYSLRWKAGISYESGPHHFGLMIHTPNVAVYSTGTLLSDNVLVNMKIFPDLPPVNLVANTRQEHLRIKWHVPLSIAGAYAYKFSRGLIYFSSEYFFKVNEYNVLTPRAEFFLRPDTGNSNLLTPDILSLKDARKAIVNFSVGMSVPITQLVDADVSFRTDFSYAERTLQTDNFSFAPYTCYWNNYHVEGGGTLRKKDYSVRGGIFVVYGASNNYVQLVNFDNPSESNALQGTPMQVPARHIAAGIMLSFIHNL